LEWVKPSFVKTTEGKPGISEPIDAAVYEKTVDFFEELMQMLHPFTPFITEEIYHELRERKEGDDITIRQMTAIATPKPETLQLASLLKEVITALRDVRVKNQLKPKDSIKLSIETSQQEAYQRIESILAKQANAESILFASASATASISFVVQKDKFYIETEKEIDTASQKEQLLKDLDYLKGFLSSVEKKLGNDRFVQNAKQEVIEIERRKKTDAEAKIKAIEESLQAL
jgi:valyl-tRNA synthetase